MATTKGIMGAIDLGFPITTGSSGFVRATSFDLKATQTLETLDTVDGVYDRTAWRITPLMVEGGITFPVPATQGVFNKLVEYAAKRTTDGKLQNKHDIVADYDNNIKYKYTECLVNSFSGTVTSEEAVEFTFNVIGSDRQVDTADKKIDRQSPERVLTWNDIEIIGLGVAATASPNLGDAISFSTPQVRNLSFEINNNVTRFFGLDGRVRADPNNIIPGKREITGSVEAAFNGFLTPTNAIQTFNADVSNVTSRNEIRLTISKGGTNETGIAFQAVVYDIEDISLTNDFFMGTVGWKAFGNSDDTQYRAIKYKKNFTDYI